MKKSWKGQTLNHVQELKNSFALNQNTFNVLIAPKVLKYGPMKTQLFAKYANKKLEDPKKKLPV